MLVLKPMASAVPEFLARDRAFEALYRQHVKDVYHYALALLRNPADAEDVTQTTFMNAYRAYQRGEEIRKPKNWLIKIAHNAARTRYARASSRVKEVPLEDHVDQLAVAEEERTNVEAVLRALGRLPLNQRAALVMRELEGRSYTEIAETLDVSVSAVETLIFRARKALRLRASSLRVLTAVPLPGSLGPIGGGAVVAGGGAVTGMGFLGKAAIALIAGGLATGIGGDRTRPAVAAEGTDGAAVPASVAGRTPAAQSGTAPTSDAHAGVLERTGDSSAEGAATGTPVGATTGTPVDGVPGVQGTANPLGAAPGAEAQTSNKGPSSPLGPVQTTVTQIADKVEDAAAALPLPVTVPVPTVPALPAVPTLPTVPTVPTVPLELPPPPPLPKLP